MKGIIWLGNSKKAIRKFPKEAREDAGYQLFQIQLGIEPDDWKPMSSVGRGAIEIRVHDPFEHRVIYVAKFEGAIHVLHAFEKKTKKTPKKEIEIAKKAYRELMNQRRSK